MWTTCPKKVLWVWFQSVWTQTQLLLHCPWTKRLKWTAANTSGLNTGRSLTTMLPTLFKNLFSPITQRLILLSTSVWVDPSKLSRASQILVLSIRSPFQKQPKPRHLSRKWTPCSAYSLLRLLNCMLSCLHPNLANLKNGQRPLGMKGRANWLRLSPMEILRHSNCMDCS